MSETDRQTPWSWLDDAYPYALDALTTEQRRAIDHRLDAAGPEETEQFHTAVHRIQETLASLTAVDSVPPPARLEAALMRALDRLDPQVRPLIRRDSRWRLRWLTVAAAAIIAVGAGAGIAVVMNQVDDPSGTLTAQQVLEDPDSRSSSVPITGGGAMTVHQSTSLGAAAVSLGDMPALPTDRAYQLWLIPDGGSPQSVAVMDASATGSVVTPVASTDTLAVTVEPAGGSPGPTTQPIVSMVVG
ncbi:anti-sigma factor [Nocardia sp. AG03]|uniref:anti-sigma factor n=1 Tax=Nocardia sp. AG03 TaxID=3025312 RepID=UPI002418A6E6|nr:anti-sigma factor [Nocardia sp. AG03]